MASGLAVAGFVLALQMYYALVTYGAAESLGLTRQPGPGARTRSGRDRFKLFAGRAGTSLTARSA